MLKRFLLAIAVAAAPSVSMAAGAASDISTAMPGGTAPPVPAGAQNSFQLVWVVFLGGINLGTVGIKTSFSGDSYSSVSRLKTAGVLNSFYEAVIDASAVGTLAGDVVHPQKYDSSYNGEKSNQRVSLAYASSGGIQLFSEPAYDVNRFPVSEDQKRDTVDPLSGIVFAISGVSITPEKKCGDTVRVFDGRRRYDVELTYVAQENVSTSGGYSGPTTKCEMRYKQIAGFKQTLTKTPLPTISVWFATFPTKEPGPVKAFAVPVRLIADTPFGAAIAHARKITIDGEDKNG
jgi:uncharacterized protein DUF3108